MKRIQRVISFLLALVMVIGMVPPMAVSAEETEPAQAVTEAVKETTVPTESTTELAEETVAFNSAATVEEIPEPVLTYRVLRETEEGWTLEEWDEAGNNGLYGEDDLTYTPGEYWLAFYLNTWDAESESWEHTPVHVEFGEYLSGELMEEGDYSVAPDAEDTGYYYYVTVSEECSDEITAITDQNLVESFSQANASYATATSGYLSEKCTYYPCAGTLIIEEGCNPCTLPCNSDTAAKFGYVSESLSNKRLYAGDTVVANALYTNSEGNYWYKVKLSDGTDAFVWSNKGYLDTEASAYIKDGDFPDVISGSESLTGTVIPKGAWLNGVYAIVYKKGSASANAVLTSYSEKLNKASSYDLRGSVVDDGLPFGTLTDDEYILEIYADITTYEASEGELSEIGLCVLADDYPFQFIAEEETCTITFNANGGSCSESTVTINKGTAIGSLPTPTRDGYSFEGWYTSSSGGTEVTSSTTFNSNTTIYAHWSQIITVDLHETLAELTDADYLAFAAIAYEEFGTSGTIEKNLSEIDKWQAEWSSSPSITYAELCKFISQWKVFDISNYSSYNGFYAVAFKNDNDEVVIAYRGSENPFKIITKLDWDAFCDWLLNDFPIELGNNLGIQFDSALAIYNSVAKYYDVDKIKVTGHSLGGAWADAISAYSGCQGVTFNAVSVLDVLYKEKPAMMGRTFTGANRWNFVDHTNQYDVLAGMFETYISTKMKPYKAHKSNINVEPGLITTIVSAFASGGLLTLGLGATTATGIILCHGMQSFVSKNSSGTVSLNRVESSFTPSSGITNFMASAIHSVDFGTSIHNEFRKGLSLAASRTSYGGDGNDTIISSVSGDILIGGRGDDTLIGGNGNDTYIYFKGDGCDTITDTFGKDVLNLEDFSSNDVIHVNSNTDYIEVTCNGNTIVRINKAIRGADKERVKSSFRVYVDRGGSTSDEYNITEYFKTKKYVSRILIGCPVDVQITDADNKVVYTVNDGAEGEFFTDYGNFYVYEEEDGGYGKVLELVEGYSARVVGVASGMMEVSYQNITDGELSEVQSAADIPVSSTTTAVIEENDAGQLSLQIDNDGDNVTDQEVVLETQHAWNDGIIGTAATCTTDGNKIYTCTVCGETSTEVIEATGHAYEAEVTDPTCTEQGYTTYFCECGDYYDDMYVEPLGHSYQDCLCVRCGEPEPASGTCGENLTWTFDPETNTLTISGTGDMTDYSADNPAPWIGYGSFLLYLVIEEGITGIGDYAFADCEYTELLGFPATLTSIGESAFSGMAYLDAIKLPAGVLKIGADAFGDCDSLNSVTFMGNAPEVTGTIFSGDYGVTAYYPFGNNTWTDKVRGSYVGITNWCWHDSNGSVGGDCGNNLFWSLNKRGVMTFSGTGEMECYDKQYAPWYDKLESIYSVIIQDGITSIADHAFYDCYHLQKILISDSVTIIGTGTFEGCTKLSTISIPENVTSIGAYAFASCNSLSEISIPAGVSYIQDATFDSCYNLARISIPDSIMGIGVGSFYECSSLTSISIPAGVVSIEDSAFSGCHSLRSINIPDGVTSIGAYAFDSCDSLTTISIPPSVVNLGDGAFYYCDTLSAIKFRGNPCNLGKNLFYDVTATVYYPADDQTWTADVMQDYGGNIIWKTYCDDSGVIASGNCGTDLSWSLDAEGVLVVSGNGRMRDFDYEDVPWHDYRDSILSCIIESGVTTISPNTFDTCKNMVSISIPDTVTTIECDFSECLSLTSIIIPAGVTKLAPSIFDRCSNLSTLRVAYDNSAYASEDNLLYNRKMDSLLRCPPGMVGELIIPDSVTNIAEATFAACGNLTSVILPLGLDVIPHEAFLDCNNLTTVTIPNSVTKISERAFYNCDMLTNVVIPNSVRTISFSAFSNCNALTEIVIPVSIAKMESGAFSGCCNLQLIRFEGDAPVSDTDESINSGNVFDSVNATAYYPVNNETWTEEVMQGYGGTITWLSYESEEQGYIASGTCGANLTWTLSVNGTLTILGSGEMEDYSSYSSDWYNERYQIASVIINEGVTTIGSNAFNGCIKMNSISIPETVTQIGSYAFYECSGLNSITIPNTITSIASRSFARCYGLSNIVIPNSVTSIGSYAFEECIGLTEISLSNCINSIETGTFKGCNKLTEVVIPENVTSIEGVVFSGCSSLSSIFIPKNVTQIIGYPFDNCKNLTEFRVDSENPSFASDDLGVLYNKDYTILKWCPPGLEYCTIHPNTTKIGDYAFYKCTKLSSIIIPKSVKSIGSYSFSGCSKLTAMRFLGDACSLPWRQFLSGFTATIYYPAENETWTLDVMNRYGGNLTWVPYDNIENRICVDVTDLVGHSSVWVDGMEYAVQVNDDRCFVDLPDNSAKTMITYTYHVDDSADIHTQYPISMKVWSLKNEDGIYTATRVENLDNILQYSGSSIRVTGKQGIRMITSIEKSKKNALTTDGLYGYTLKEYGTVAAWANPLNTGKPLTLGQSYVKSNYAYKKGIADPVFADDGNLIQYTNVLVGFSMDQCKDDLAMRPYMILADADGNEIIIYGGIVQRSIGYIAAQNANAFDPVTEANAYNYVWDIIRHIYGEAYIPASA